MQRQEPTMEVGTTRRPGQKGTKRLLERFGSKLLYVRYRYDRHTGRRYTTVELVVDSQPWSPRSPSGGVCTAPDSCPAPDAPRDGPAGCPGDPSALVGLRVGVDESDVRARVKAAGGQWSPQKRVWLLPLRRVRALRLQDRIVPETR
jgi:hypothetical protein